MSNEPIHPSPLVHVTSVSSAPRWQTFFSVSLIVAVGLAVLQWHECAPLRHSNRHASLPFMVARDSEYYRAIAENHFAEVESPFSKRVLYPLLANYLAQSTGVAIPTAFMFLNVVSLAMLAYCLAEALRLLI